jgi:hypothetical protein
VEVDQVIGQLEAEPESRRHLASGVAEDREGEGVLAHRFAAVWPVSTASSAKEGAFFGKQRGEHAKRQAAAALLNRAAPRA